jgi:hypothetical protein
MKVKIGHADAASVGHLLRSIGRSRRLPDVVRSDAAHWASEMRGRMDRQDMRAVAWVIRDAYASGQLSAKDAEQAHFWAAYLEERS